jgi:predicted Rossmann-fold nucleotide-binding protein
MFDRMNTMFNHADAFIALPGGLGTLKNIFHIFSWAQLHIHYKAISLLNVKVFMIICCLFLIKLRNRNF